MRKAIVVSMSLVILAVSGSASLAARKHHHRMVAATPVMVTAMGPAGPGVQPGTADYDKYVKNLRDSGYDTKKNFNADGTMRIRY